MPFYVMEEVHGSVITSDVPPALDHPQERGRIGEELVDALAEIHAVDWRAAGLEGFGKPSGYLERQLRRFNGLWEHNKTRELEVVSEVGQWLADNLPDSGESTIVHGDYRLGNAMVADDAPARVVSVFDWELATIGDPLADVGYLTVTWAAGRRPRRDGVRLPVGRHPQGGLSHPRPARGALRAGHGALGRGAELVPGPRAVEGGGVHGGQLQALRGGLHRRRVPGAVRRGRARAGREGALRGARRLMALRGV
ncbi:MAG: phosphotransferase family protein [Thermoleophilaceae bacterium]